MKFQESPLEVIPTTCTQLNVCLCMCACVPMGLFELRFSAWLGNPLSFLKTLGDPKPLINSLLVTFNEGSFLSIRRPIPNTEQDKVEREKIITKEAEAPRFVICWVRELVMCVLGRGVLRVGA